MGQPKTKTPEFELFSAEQLLDNTVTDFELYLKLSEHLVLYSSHGYHWEKRELEDLLREGHKNFIIKAEDLPKVKMYAEMAKLPEIDKHEEPAQRIHSIEQVGASFTRALFEGEITETCVDKAKQLGNSIVQCLKEDQKSILHISELASHDYYTYHHSIRVATYAVAIALEMGQKDEQQLNELALGAIFHDIGKKYLPLSLLHKAGTLTEEEWAQIRSHPELGRESIKELSFGHVPAEIIIHHHEKLDGTGYPHALEGDAILPEVQIVTLADVFDALTSVRSYQKKRSNFNALDFIKQKMLGEKISRDTFKALVASLAEKEPD